MQCDPKIPGAAGTERHHDAAAAPPGAVVLGTFWATHLGDTLCTTPLPRLLRERSGEAVYVAEHPMLRAVFAHNPHVSGFAAGATLALDTRAVGSGHVIQRLQQGLGLAVDPAPKPELFLSDDERAWAARQRQLWPVGRPACVVSAGAVTDAANLSRVDWAEVVRVLSREYTVVQAALSEDALPGAVVYRGLKLRDYMALVSAADLFLGGTSGGSHVAAALGVPALIVGWRSLLDPLRFPVSGQGVTAAFLYPQHWFVAAEDLAADGFREKHLRSLLEGVARHGPAGRPIGAGGRRFHPCGFVPAAPRRASRAGNRWVRLRW